jgi:hypothetical protein
MELDEAIAIILNCSETGNRGARGMSSTRVAERRLMDSVSMLTTTTTGSKQFSCRSFSWNRSRARPAYPDRALVNRACRLGPRASIPRARSVLVSAALPPIRRFSFFGLLRGSAPRARKASQHVPPHPHVYPRRAGPSCGASAFRVRSLLATPGLADGQGRCSNTRMPARRRQRSARVRIPCELAESEIASTESPSCSMMWQVRVHICAAQPGR